jgi:hypothetical protein
MAVFKCETARVFGLDLADDYERTGTEESGVGSDRVE